MPISPVAVVETFIAQWTGGRDSIRQSFADWLTEDVRYENVGLTFTTTRDQACALVDSFSPQLDSISVDMLAIASVGDRVLTERIDYLHKADGSIIKTFRLMGIFLIRDGKISEWRDYFHLVASGDSTSPAG